MTTLTEEERYWLDKVLDDQLGDQDIPPEIAEVLLARQLIAWSHAAASYIRGIRASTVKRPD